MLSARFLKYPQNIYLTWFQVLGARVLFDSKVDHFQMLCKPTLYSYKALFLFAEPQ